MALISNAVDLIGQKIRLRGPNPTFNYPVGEWGNPWDWPHSATTSSGVYVQDNSALGLTAFYRGVKLISDSIAGLPLHVYRKQPGEDTPALFEQPDTAYLRRRPNSESHHFRTLQHVIADQVRSDGFVWIDPDVDTGKPLDMWYLNRRRVRVGRTSDGQKVYLIDNNMPMIDYADGGEIVHFPNWGDGLVGYDLTKLFREVIGLGISAQEYAALYFKTDGVPPGYLSTDQVLTPTESDQVALNWQRRQTGKNQRRIAVLSGGSKFYQLQNDPDKSQMQQIRTFQGEEVARFLGVPPMLIGFPERESRSASGIAELNQHFLTYTLNPYITLDEEILDDDLLVRELTHRYCKFDQAAFLRGTTLQRYQAYGIGYGRWLTPNDIRRDEDLPLLPGGDELPTGANLIPLDELSLEDRPQPAGNRGNPSAPGGNEDLGPQPEDQGAAKP